MSAAAPFRIEAEGYWVLGRMLLGFAFAMLMLFGFSAWWSSVLVACVWLDAGTGWFFRRRGLKSASTTALETYADFVCFVLAPMVLVLVLTVTIWPLVFTVLFLLAATYRLARFQVQGVTAKGYVGLPVTYNGYLFPLGYLAIIFFPAGADIILIGLLLFVSVLMVSTRLTVPEF